MGFFVANFLFLFKFRYHKTAFFISLHMLFNIVTRVVIEMLYSLGAFSFYIKRLFCFKYLKRLFTYQLLSEYFLVCMCLLLDYHHIFKFKKLEKCKKSVYFRLEKCKKYYIFKIEKCNNLRIRRLEKCKKRF